MARFGDELGKPRFKWPGTGCGAAGNRRDGDGAASTGGTAAVGGGGVRFGCGVGAEGKSEGGRSELDFGAGGASMRCSSGRGGATLFNTFGLILTAGPGGGDGRR